MLGTTRARQIRVVIGDDVRRPGDVTPHEGNAMDPHAQGITGTLGCRHVDDIQASVRGLLDAGTAVGQEVRDVGDGRLVASVTDADGNAIGLLQSA